MMLFLWLFLMRQPDAYIVVYSRGEIHQQTVAGNRIVQGSRIRPDDRLFFMSADAYARVAGKEGTYQLANNHDSRKTPVTGELGQLVREILIPTTISGDMRTRGGTITNWPEAESFFARFNDSARPMLLIDKRQITISSSLVPDTGRCFFYLSYRRDKDTINKRLPWTTTGKSLQIVFDRRLFEVDGRDMGTSQLPQTNISFYNGLRHESTRLANMWVRYVSFSFLQPELCLVRAALSGNPGGANPDTMLLNYITVYYGQPDEDQFTHYWYPILNCK
ncbi:MAG: hypothetical protein J0H74_15475 [Chitinophagaceae bacterium]|nr:hypothetical protein [Chitinophagaceae bacterium]